MVHALFQVDCSEMCLQCLYTIYLVFIFFLSPYMFSPVSNPAVWQCDVTSWTPIPWLLIDSSVSTSLRWATCHHSRMVSKRLWCSVLGSNKEHSRYNVPKSEPLKTQWLSFVFKGNIPHEQYQCFHVCMNNFSPDCFINEGQ